MISLTWDSLSPDVQRRNPQLKELLTGKSESKSKYGNNRVMVDGIWFDSQKEANKYVELILEQRAGIVVMFELQPKFLLQAGYVDYQTKKWVQAIHYIADFRVTYADGRVVVIDSKGFKNQVYLMKKKMFRQKYPDVVFVEE